jgi:hypothetical protein
MGKYTELDDAAIEKTVDHIITDITAQLVSHFHPRSVILAGSFARGEAAIINRGGKLVFLSDCEAVLVANRYITTQRINKKLGTAIAQEDMPKFVIRSSIALPIYSLIPLRPFLWKPNIWNYELKYGSRTLHGNDYVAKMPDFKAAQIPVWEGIRLIFNRMAEALRYYRVDSGLSTAESELETIFWIIKIILACQDALLIAAGEYTISCRTRNALFTEIFNRDFAELEVKIPHFASLANKATNHKLKQASFGMSTDRLWFDTAEICDVVLRYLLQKNMGIEFDNYLELQEKFLKHPILQQVMTLARKVSTRSLVLSLPSVIRTGGPWTHLVYPAIALMYFSLSRDGEINMSLLEGVRNTVSLFKRTEPFHSDTLEEWTYLKDEVYHLWYALGV